jgi:hypothetical protein
MIAPRSPLAPEHPVSRLRRIAEVLEIVAQHDDAEGDLKGDSAWLASAIRTYEADGPAGLGLDEAFGLALRRGITPWWEQEARHRRDELIRQTAAEYFPDLGLAAAAAEIRRAAIRARHQRKGRETGPGALLAEARRFMEIPQTPKVIQQILEMK